MHSSVPVLFLAAALTVSTMAIGQHSRRKIEDSTIAKNRAIDRIFNRPKEGMILPEFMARTRDGATVTNNSLFGKVSLLIFWDPWCKCFNPDALGALPGLAKQR